MALEVPVLPASGTLHTARKRPGRLATKFGLVSESLGGRRPSLNRMAASDKNSDAAIQARFSGSAKRCKESILNLDSIVTMPATVLPPQPVLFPSLAGLDRAIAMIIVSEIGDKTFLLAALLAMQHPRLIVFTGAFLALLVMSVLSAGLGHVLPTLISRQYTVLAASALFLVFGLKMLREGMEMEGGTGKVQEEIEEIEHEIREKGEDLEPEHARLEEARPTARSRQLTGRRGSIKRSRSQESKNGLKNLSYLLISPVLIQTFIMTFLAEWGDRSQISTIALAAAHNVYIVSLGTVLGHALCTFFAVMGGRWLATKISVKYGP
ncbi:hypothetical protein PCANC_21816 [Puccinia coronata f. sp. avenae]|uniref:GDT1 family protein n=1 Tax=Puccinia coronata f. sp. avenae TaxID=200324 RepID=A0A2N5SGD7_9BASI|nr:hypothetical protein PCANC_21816 [Puccinia coronata f. sp. avenae]